MAEPLTSPTISVARLSDRADVPFCFVPDDETRTEIADRLDLRALRKVRLEGRLIPFRGGDWRLEAMLGATAVQSCVVTLEPVTTRIDTEVLRTYVADGIPEPEGETEMPEDETIEALLAMIDLRDLIAESLALALPDYPRADGAEPVDESFTPPGVAPLREEDTKPFAALKVLKGGTSEDADS